MSTALTTTPPHSPLLALGDELLRMLALHLKPRHLQKLLRANKALNKLLMEHECYWTRVAAHLTYRNYIIGRAEYNHPLYKKPVNEQGVMKRSLYDMVNLKRGYFNAMETFISMIPAGMKKTLFLCVPIYIEDCEWTKEDEGVEIMHEGDYWGLCDFADASLGVKVRRAVTIQAERGHFIEGVYTVRETSTISFYEICKREVEGLTRTPKEFNKAIWNLIHELDDIPNISIQDKKKIGHSIVKAFTTTDFLWYPERFLMNNGITEKVYKEHKDKGDFIKKYMACFTT